PFRSHRISVCSLHSRNSKFFRHTRSFRLPSLDLSAFRKQRLSPSLGLLSLPERSAQVFVNHFEQFVVHCTGLLAAFFQCLSGAMAKMVSHERPPNASQSLLGRRDLDDDVGAITVLFHHFLQAPDLPFDTSKAL